MSLLLIALLSIFLIYFIFAFLPFRICAICAAVSLTCLWLLVGYFLNWHQNILLIAILMGGSVVGLMYKIEKYFEKKRLTNFWLVRILIIILGYLNLYFFLKFDWDKFIFSLIISILAGFMTLFFIKPKTSLAPTSKLKQELKNKLDHCCD